MNDTRRPALRTRTRLDPCTLVIFGVTGDLTYRKLAPALYDLSCNELLEERFTVVGYGAQGARRRGPARPHAAFRRRLLRCRDRRQGRLQARAHEPALRARRVRRSRRLRRVCGRPSRGSSATATRRPTGSSTWRRRPACSRPSSTGWGRPGSAAGSPRPARSPPPWPRARRRRSRRPAGGRPGAAHAAVLDEDDLAFAEPPDEPAGWTRIVIEKPFGSDLAGAKALNRLVRSVFHERQVYRIDHYLGKETVQNILMFRFANVIFEPIWNRRYVDHVQITAAETLGVEHRGPYYEEAGRPARHDPEPSAAAAVAGGHGAAGGLQRRGRARREGEGPAGGAAAPARTRCERYAVRGQYGDGVIAGQAVRAYREEERVSPQSNVETYAALKLFIDNWRWEGVPFYLRTGKRLPQAGHRDRHPVQAAALPALPQGRPDAGQGRSRTSWCCASSPTKASRCASRARCPAKRWACSRWRWISAGVRRWTSCRSAPTRRCCWTSCSGDATLFNRDDQVEESWRLVEPVLEAWRADLREIDGYVAGSWGPESAVVMLAADGREWRRP